MARATPRRRPGRLLRDVLIPWLLLLPFLVLVTAAGLVLYAVLRPWVLLRDRALRPLGATWARANALTGQAPAKEDPSTPRAASARPRSPSEDPP